MRFSMTLSATMRASGPNAGSCRAFVGDGRRSAGRFFCRTAGHDSERARRGTAHRSLSSMLRFALDRPRDLVSAARGFDHFEVALSIGIQPMVRSDQACSGVMFTLDTECGFRDVVVINGAWGLGEAVVQGMATPDEWIVFKPTLKTGSRPIVSRRLGGKEVKMVYGLTGAARGLAKSSRRSASDSCLGDYEVLELARWACMIEEHYSELAGKLDADGHRMGQGRLHRRTLYPAGATRNGSRQQSRKLHRNLPAHRRARRAARFRHRRR